MSKSDDDRTVICRIISEMLDNPDSYGIYPTTKCYDALEKYCQSIRAEAMVRQREKDACIAQQYAIAAGGYDMQVSKRKNSECIAAAIRKQEVGG